MRSALIALLEVSEGWRISRSASIVLRPGGKGRQPVVHVVLRKALERIGLMPVVPGLKPFASRAVDVDGGLMTWMFSSLLLRDADEVQYRFWL